ncbi:MAG: SDR family oxidoreductase [Deltaproteobacteria bacterium]|nr:SDR family oxidoreductase [Deltaproteobacteria bacterium]
MFRLDNKITVIIGGAGGIGEACATALAGQGAKVIVADMNLEKAKIIADRITSAAGSEAVAMPVDVGNEESIREMADSVVKKFGTIDILVNSQGINAKMPAADINMETWDSLFRINVRGVVLPCKVIGKIMIEKKKGKIINLSSVRGIRGTDGGNVTYGATKGSVDMITRMLAAEWAQYNINVNAIGPSVVMTEMVKKAIAPERLQLLLSKTLFKRFIEPKDVAAACVYLASDEADNVTGQIMYVDGGLTAIG